MKIVPMLATGLVGIALAIGGWEAAAQTTPDQPAPDKTQTKAGREATRSAKQTPSTADPTVVVIVSQGNAKAVEGIARARCEREKRCDNVGSKKKWASSQDCLQKVSADWGDDLNAYQCPGGIDAPALDKCVAAIRGQECGKAMDALARVLACRVNDICNET